VNTIETKINNILERKATAPLCVQSLGYFRVAAQGTIMPDSDWKRDIAVQLFQYFITIRNQHALHKAQIIDRLWGDMDEVAGNRNFKAALHQLSKVIEPNKAGRSKSKFIIRQGMSYLLDMSVVWLDIDVLDELITIGDDAYAENPSAALIAYEKAIELYKGEYLPNRIYEDWTIEERERIQVMVLDTLMTLAKLKLKTHPKESIRLSKKALLIDATWEEAYRIQMEAYMQEGNRPLAVKIYQRCQQILKKEFDIDPLPETNALFRKIRNNI